MLPWDDATDDEVDGDEAHPASAAAPKAPMSKDFIVMDFKILSFT